MNARGRLFVVAAFCILACVLQVAAQARGRIDEIEARRLPHEARETLHRIKAGGPFRHARDGIPFGNRERLLPGAERGYYREYTVATPGVSGRGARRIVAGARGEYYYTDDHYRSFRRIKE